MLGDYMHCCRDNPLRPPDWRWRRAMGIIACNQPAATRRRDGPIGFKWIRKIVRFWDMLEHARSDWDQQTVATLFPDLFWAWYTWQNDNSTLKRQAEAYMLARCDSWETAFKTGLLPDAVDAYACVFFDVAEKLNHTGYILNVVLGPQLQRGLNDQHYDILWKLYAYYYGPHAVDSLVSKMTNPMWCSSPDTLSAAYQDDTINTMKMKSSLAAKTVPITRDTQLELLHIFNKFVEIERSTDSIGKAQDQMLEHISAMLTSLPFTIGNRDPRLGELIPPGPSDAYSHTHVELSYEETMRVAAGQELPYAETLRQLNFPARGQVIDVERMG
jgi:hypothetical protein